MPRPADRADHLLAIGRAAQDASRAWCWWPDGRGPWRT